MSLKSLKINKPSDVSLLAGNLYDCIIDEGVLGATEPKSRPNFLQSVKKALGPNGVYKVICKNRVFSESTGDSSSAPLLSINEFMTLLCDAFLSVRFQGGTEGGNTSPDAMSEVDPWFMAECHASEETTRKSILVLGDDESTLVPLCRELLKRGYQVTASLLGPVQQVSLQHDFPMIRIRGLAQLIHVSRIAKPDLILATGKLKNAGFQLAEKQHLLATTNLDELDKLTENSPARTPKNESQPKIGVVWEGSFFVHHSLARVNEEICHSLNQDKISLSLFPYEPPQFSDKDERRLGTLVPNFFNLPNRIDFHVRHQWPPHWEMPPEGEYILMQPWEFGSIPKYWLEQSPKVREIWTYTHFVKDSYVRSGFPEEQVQVIPLGVNPDLFSPLGEKLKLKTEKSFCFLYVGGLIGRKGIDLLLKAYLEEFKENEDVCLIIRDFYYRNEWGQQLKKIASEPGRPEVLYFTDSLLPQQLPQLYRSCHAYVQPYRGEGFGLPILEAMACGLPTIVTGYGAALDFCHSGNAYLLPAKLQLLHDPRVGELETVDRPFLAEPDLGALKAILRQVFQNYSEAAHRGLLAAQEVAHDWTWKHAAIEVEKRLEKLKTCKNRVFPPGRAEPTQDYVSQYNAQSVDLNLLGEGKPSWTVLEAHRLLESAPEQAEMAFQKLLATPHWKGEALYGLGRLTEMKGKYEDALKIFEDVVEELPFHTLAWKGVSNMARKLGLEEKASWASLETVKLTAKLTVKLTPKILT